jgi:hypothetical protein
LVVYIIWLGTSDTGATYCTVYRAGTAVVGDPDIPTVAECPQATCGISSGSQAYLPFLWFGYNSISPPTYAALVALIQAGGALPLFSWGTFSPQTAVASLPMPLPVSIASSVDLVVQVETPLQVDVTNSVIDVDVVASIPIATETTISGVVAVKSAYSPALT